MPKHPEAYGSDDDERLRERDPAASIWQYNRRDLSQPMCQPLQPEEERALLSEYQQARHENPERAAEIRQRVIASCMCWVAQVALGYARRYGGTPDLSNTLMQAGYEELCKAFKSFDPTRGIPFFAYVCGQRRLDQERGEQSETRQRRLSAVERAIRDACSRYGKGAISVPGDMQKRIARYHAFIVRFKQEQPDGFWPSDDEAAYHLNLSLEQVKRVRSAWALQQSQVPVDASSTEDSTAQRLPWDASTEEWDGRPRPQDPTAATIEGTEIDEQRLEVALARFTRKQKALLAIVAAYRDEDEKLLDKEIANTLGIKRAGATRLRNRAYATLREPLEQLCEEFGRDAAEQLLRDILDRLQGKGD